MKTNVESINLILAVVWSRSILARLRLQLKMAAPAPALAL